MRLIDADSFVEDIKTEIMNLYLDGMKGTPRPRSELYDIIDRIGEQPTVDAAPVVHGQWRWGLNAYKQHGAWCTRCGCGWEYNPGDFDRVQGLVNAHKYCPNCGAKMDK